MAKKAQATAPDDGASQNAGADVPADTQSLPQTIHAASQQALKDANHSAHAILEDLLQAVHVMKVKLEAAAEHVEGDLADALAKIRELL